RPSNMAREAAAKALGQLQAIGALPALLVTSATDQDTAVRQAADAAIDQVRELTPFPDLQAAAEPVPDLLMTAPGWTLRVAATRTLARHEIVEAIPALLSALAKVRARAQRRQFKWDVSNYDVSFEVRRGLEDEYTSVRKEADAIRDALQGIIE